jgi:hypothetical protein
MSVSLQIGIEIEVSDSPPRKESEFDSGYQAAKNGKYFPYPMFVRPFERFKKSVHTLTAA